MILEARTLKQEAVTEALKLAPAVGGGFWAVATSSQLVAAVTIIYIVSQIVYLHWKWHHERKEKK